MPRFDLLARLAAHTAWDATESEMLRRTWLFAVNEPHCLDPEHPPGHITGSAWVLDPAGTSVLLTHHRKLDRWLQLGGHVDPGETVLKAALREAEEESGIPGIRPIRSAVFDVDVHEIPARGPRPAHFHYDVRFVLRAERRAPVASSESRDLRWVPIADVAAWNPAPSVVRMVEKTLRMRKI